ncbi:MAG TPA: FAD-binding oxidoreductase, partial [Gemmatimonadales bacterium]|nr:FAD-binding oxidoreductase [Gemmatimonadales bacterium]
MPLVPPSGFRGRFRTDERARAAYAEAAGIYRIVPQAACLPADADDLVRLVRWAADFRVPLVPRGAGSAMPGGNVGDGVVVDLSSMAGPELRVDPHARRARMRAGATLGQLDAAAAPAGLRLPPDPSSSRWATAGGAVSTNAAGARSARYGSVRGWVESVDMVTADGERVELRRGAPASRVATIRRFHEQVAASIRAAADLVARRFPQTRKNAAGYALDAWLRSGDELDLVIGAEGTLGFVTAVEWRLDPAPAERAGLRIALREYGPLPDIVARLRALEATAVELLDRTFLDIVGRHRPDELPAGAGEMGAVLLVELEDDSRDVLAGRVGEALAAARALGLDAEA